MGQYFLIWRTQDRRFHIEGLFDALDTARDWLKADLAAKGTAVRGNWVVNFGEVERWSLQTSEGVYRIDPVPLNVPVPHGLGEQE